MRTFVAIPVTEEALVAPLVEVQRALSSGGRLRAVPRHQLHFTLKFLGEVDDARVAAAREATLRAALGVAPFELALRGAGAFPRPAAARVVWVGCGTGGDQLVALAARVEEAFAAAGFPAESRPFSPHLTIARTRDGSPPRGLAEALRLESERSFGVLRVHEIVLVKSVLGSAGADHTQLLRAALS